MKGATKGGYDRREWLRRYAAAYWREAATGSRPPLADRERAAVAAFERASWSPASDPEIQASIDVKADQGEWRT